MKRVKRRTFSGAVCEQEIFNIRENQDIKTAQPGKERFQSEAERAAHREAISRRRHIQLINTNFTHNSLYSTLTLNNTNEVHYYEDMKRLRDNYIRRLQRRFPDAVISAYIGQGKNSRRFHMHMISDGIPESAIRSLWGYGRIDRVEHLREHNIYDGTDHGEDYTGLANYLFDHWIPEYGGHRYRITRNAARPEKEEPKEIKRNYTEAKPPAAPKGYILVETRSNSYGYLYFKYVRIPESRYMTRKKNRSGYYIEE